MTVPFQIRPLKINEIFYSIQGEGASTGKPTLFIRLSGCTLKCNFCDTKYHVKSRLLDNKDKKLLKKYKHWTITGGEPLLQQDALYHLIKEYKPNFVEIETNGTIIPSLDFANLISCFNCSPKEPRFQPKGMKKHCTEPKLLACGVDDRVIKFVYTDKKSERFINSIIRNKKYKIIPAEVWIMPEGKTRKEQEAMQKKVWEYCIRKGFHFSPRLQVSVFNTKRGI